MLNTINSIISKALAILGSMDITLGNRYNHRVRSFPEYTEITIEETLNEAVWIIDEINLMKQYLGA